MQVRPVRRDEIAAYLAVTRVGFHSPAEEGEEAERTARRFAERRDPSRVLGAFDGDRVVGTFVTFTTELTVPGGALVPACAVSGVTVLPTHRRRGALSSMMRAGLADAAAGRGEAVAILVASEYPIYGRFGFGPAADAAGLELRVHETRLLGGEGPGRVDLVSAEELAEAAPAVYEAHRRATPGAIAREPWWWRTRVGLEPGWQAGPAGMQMALARDADGSVRGLACWKVDGGFEQHRPAGVLDLVELVGVDTAAEARLWRFVCEIDLVTTVRCERRPVDDPLRWLVADARAVRQTWRADWLWARLLDVPVALSARRYAAPGAVVVEVADELGHAAGRYALETGSDGGGACVRSDAAPDVTLPVATLSACYLGGPSLLTMAGAGLAEEHRPGALAELSRMLRSDATPYCATMF